MDSSRSRAAALLDQLRRPVLEDIALTVLLLVSTLAFNNAGFILRKINGELPNAPWPTDLYLWWAATTLCLTTVLCRRRWPVAALAVAMAAAMTQMALGAGPVAADLAVPIALHTIAATHRRTTSLAVLALALLVVGVWSLWLGPDGRIREHPAKSASSAATKTAPAVPRGVITEEPSPNDLFGLTGWGGFPVLGPVLVAGWAIGWSAQNRRAYLDELKARARDLEHERDQRAALAAAAERSRITRELHDVVAHGLAAIVMQAQGGKAMLELRPAKTSTALDTIIQTGRTSLAEMRQVLAAVGAVDGSSSPVPGLDRLPELVEHVRRSGTQVSLRVEGKPCTLPTTVDLSAYRIIQEALTNTMKHAGTGASAEVVLRYGEHRFELEITDNGKVPATPDGLGNGIRGMRERVNLLNGELYTGSEPHGFVVRVRIPLIEEPTA